MVSMLDYFEDTLENVGYPEAWLQFDSNDVTQTRKITLNVSRIES